MLEPSQERIRRLGEKRGKGSDFYPERRVRRNIVHDDRHRTARRKLRGTGSEIVSHRQVGPEGVVVGFSKRRFEGRERDITQSDQGSRNGDVGFLSFGRYWMKSPDQKRR